MKKHLVSAIETLESRIAPAGLVTASLVKGVLTINGDGQDNQLTLTQTATNLFTLSSTSGNIDLDIPGDDDPAPAASVDFGGLTGKVTISLGDGSDTVTVSGLNSADNVSVDLGKGTNILTFFAAVGGSLAVTGLEGDDTVSLSSTSVAGGVALNLGAGTNTLTATILTADKDIVVNGGAGVDTVSLGNVATDGSLTLNLGDGANVVGVPPGQLNVGKNLTINSGAGDDAFTIGELRAGGNVTISSGTGNNTNTLGGVTVSVQGKLTINNGDHMGTTTNMINATYLTIRGATVINHGSGTTNSSIAYGLGNFGGITVNGNDGNDKLEITGTFGKVKGNLVFNGGDGDDTFNLINMFGSNLDVTGGVTFKAGDGTDATTLTANGKFGSLAVDLGTGMNAENAAISGITALKLGSVNVKSQTSNSTLISLVSLDVKGATNLIVSGESNDQLTILGNAFQGAFYASTGKAGDNFTADENSFNGTFTLKTGDGMDNVNIETDITRALTSLFFKAVTIDLGADNDALVVGGLMPATAATFYNKVTYIGGSGTNTESTTNGITYPNGQPKKTGF